MPLDLKKAHREFYRATNQPMIVTVPAVHYAVVRGVGESSLKNSFFKQAVMILYAVGRTLKMSYRTAHQIDGFVPYVLPPLERFWYRSQERRSDAAGTGMLYWTLASRLPDFVTRADFDWAVQHTTEQRDMDCAYARFVTMEEGLCVQCLHIGSYAERARTIERMHHFLGANGYAFDLTEQRQHHEIYLSDARKIPPDRLRTLLRQPIRMRQKEELYEEVVCGGIRI